MMPGSLHARTSRVRYEVTREGGVYFTIIALIAAASLNTGNNLLFVILAVLLAGILASGMLARAVLSRIEISLILPERLFAGENFKGVIAIKNKKRLLPAFSLTIRPGKGGAGKRSNADGPVARAVYAPYVPPGVSLDAPVDMKYLRRGSYPAPLIEVSSKFPFSILRRKYAILSGGEVLVLPPVTSPSVLPPSPLHFKGQAAHHVRGNGDAFYTIRSYRSGDSARRVDWKATAKAQEFMVREFANEDDARLILCFDNVVRAPITPALGSRFERAVTFCASAAWDAFNSGSLLKFIGGGLETRMAPAGELIYEVLEKLALIEPATKTDGELPFAASSLAEGIPVIITDRPEIFRRISSPSRILAMEDIAKPPASWRIATGLLQES